MTPTLNFLKYGLLGGPKLFPLYTRAAWASPENYLVTFPSCRSLSPLYFSPSFLSILVCLSRFLLPFSSFFFLQSRLFLWSLLISFALGWPRILRFGAHLILVSGCRRYIFNLFHFVSLCRMFTPVCDRDFHRTNIYIYAFPSAAI